MKPRCTSCGDVIHFKGYDKFRTKIYFCKTCNAYRRVDGHPTPYEERPIEENLINIYKYRLKQ